MTTTDANGIVYLQDTDDISPFHTLINVLQAGTSNALDAKTRITRVANAAERNALTGASPTNPIYVHRVDSVTLERSVGSGFRVVAATRRGSARLASQPVVAATPSWTTLATVTATTLGGACVADVFANLANANSGANRVGSLQVTIDGVAIGPAIIDFTLPNVSAPAPYAASYSWESTPAAGAHTWVLQANGSAGSSVSALQAVITVTEHP